MSSPADRSLQMQSGPSWHSRSHPLLSARMRRKNSLGPMRDRADSVTAVNEMIFIPISILIPMYKSLPLCSWVVAQALRCHGRSLCSFTAILLIPLSVATPIKAHGTSSQENTIHQILYANWPTYQDLPLHPIFSDQAAWGVWVRLFRPQRRIVSRPVTT